MYKLSGMILFDSDSQTDTVTYWTVSLWTAEKLSNLTFKIQMILKSPAPESQIEQGIECNLLLLQSKMSRSCRKKIDEYH